MEYWGFSLCPGANEGSHPKAIRRLLQRVQVADDAGLDGWFFAEHHSDPQYSLTASPNLLVAAASQTTRRMRLGNMVTVLPYHHPFRAAEEIRLLDAMTNGRIEMGFGRGGFPHEQAAFGLERGEVPDMFETALELVLQFLTEEHVDYQTKWWRGRAATLVPGPTQSPHPPLWQSVVSDASLGRAARLGMHCNTSFAYPELLEYRMRLYSDAWDEHQPGMPTGKFGVLVQVVVADGEDEALHSAKQALEQRFERLVQGFGSPRATGPDPGFESRHRIYRHVSTLSFQELIEESLIVFGSVDQCVEQLDRLRLAGVDVITAWLHFDGLDSDFTDRSLRLLCDEVIPRVERRGAFALAGG